MNPEKRKNLPSGNVIPFPPKPVAERTRISYRPEQRKKIDVYELIANGWKLIEIDEDEEDQECLFPYYKTIVEEHGEPILELVLTTINNTYEYELGLHHLRTGILIYLRHPESYDEIAQFESMILGVDEL